MRHVTLRQLRAFLEVSGRGSFARAAQALHLTQPAVSMQVRELEQRAGLPLLERGARHVSLTGAGAEMQEYAHRVFATLKEAEDALARLRGLKGGRIVIGMVGTAEHFLPRLLAEFRKQHAQVEIRLKPGNRQQLVQALGHNEVDLAVMGRAPRELPGAQALAFASHPLAIVGSTGHRLARKRRIAPAALADESFIVREPGSGTRAAMEEFFASQGVSPRVSMEMSSNETIKQAVRADMGLAFLSLHTIAQERALKQLCVLDVAGLPLVRHWHLVHLPARTLPPAAEAFRDFVMTSGEKWIRHAFRT
jgi:DNA-binding transcriptional LysR family regulator